MRKHAVWLVTLPVALVGIEAAHALANAAFGAPGSEVLESAESGAGLIPLLAALALAAVLCGLVGRVAGLWWTPRRSRAVLLPFVLLPPLGFVLLELGEALAHSPIEWEELVGPTFLVGLALQLPVALVGYLLARALLRLSDEVRELVRRARRRPARATEFSSATFPGDDPLRGTLVSSVGLARAPPLTAIASS